ncbi:hypothetical protein WICPIJ_005828 [Wickerhamomyces pijperi]|uniref:Uncharacterized protein n=1 Tax=Wickerhamomyces pijperi TaxID=599730 RepID=A0A9P8Q572_WICPI|nr:hypothetical protein WICPIJ_005828 [Wickerhamomyces pijperi]
MLESIKIETLAAFSLFKLATENSLAVVWKNSWKISSLANLGSLALALEAIRPEGVEVEVKAKTTIGTGVAVLAVFGLKTRVFNGVAFSALTAAMERAAKEASRAIVNVIFGMREQVKD